MENKSITLQDRVAFFERKTNKSLCIWYKLIKALKPSAIYILNMKQTVCTYRTCYVWKGGLKSRYAVRRPHSLSHGHHMKVLFHIRVIYRNCSLHYSNIIKTPLWRTFQWILTSQLGGSIIYISIWWHVLAFSASLKKPSVMDGIVSVIFILWISSMLVDYLVVAFSICIHLWVFVGTG